MHYTEVVLELWLKPSKIPVKELLRYFSRILTTKYKLKSDSKYVWYFTDILCFPLDIQTCRHFQKKLNKVTSKFYKTNQSS